jgi:hypothetical protein
MLFRILFSFAIVSTGKDKFIAKNGNDNCRHSRGVDQANGLCVNCCRLVRHFFEFVSKPPDEMACIFFNGSPHNYNVVPFKQNAGHIPYPGEL